ncbi:MAG TPA: ABC transporter permease [Gemmatimonadaceae bacterium]|jgi:putative ABC transport system permease protein|nr:ABC transporter permease [Gemmatimonadaceae bacterium]
MDTLLYDVRYAARKLLNTPSFTAIAVLTLALGIGATTAVYSVVDTVLIRPLPFKDPSQLVLIQSTDRDGTADAASPLDLIDYREQNRTLSGIVMMKSPSSASLRRDGMETIRLNEERVSANFFSVLGTRPVLGRVFAAGEDGSGAPLVAVLSYHTWRDDYNGDPHIAGKSIRLDDTLYTVVGVAPAGLTYPETPDVWVAYRLQPWEISPENRGMHELLAVGRLKPGVTVAAARADLDDVAARLATQYPKSNTTVRARVALLKAQMVDPAKDALLAVLGAVVLVLLIACANVANLLLMRAAGRQTEIAVRTALGASRGRVTRQLVTEHALLTFAAATLGAVFAVWAIDGVRAYGPRALPRLDELVVNPRMLLFAATITIVTGLLFGLAPAIAASRTDEAVRLREGGRSGGGSGRMTRTRSALVVAEMALAVVLLVGAGLLLRSFARLTHVDPGFRADRVIAFDVLLSKRYEHDPQTNAFASNLIDRLRNLPGTIDVGVTNAYPFAALKSFGASTSFNVVGQPPAAPGQEPTTDLAGVSSGYFRALAIQLSKGRIFTSAEDWGDTPPVVVINQAFAHKFFPGRNPIGEHIVLGISHTTGPKPTDTLTSQGEIIGVVADTRDGSLADSVRPWTYVPFGALPFHVSGVLRTTADPATATRAIIATVGEIDPEVPVYDISTMNQALSASVAQPRFFTVLLGAFAAIALALAALGIYGVISYSVSQRTSELGIRIALGAAPDRVLRLVLGGGMTLTAAGLLVGVIGAIGFTRAISTLLFGIPPFDPLTYVGVVFGLSAVALFACWVPARRAARVDPVIAMRSV